VQRGINRSQCFFDERDYSTYLRYLSEFSTRFGCLLHAYCLMSNHAHLLITPLSNGACALFMKHLSQCYVQSVNKRLDRTGTLWEGRFYSCPVQSDAYVLACYRYIELNSVRAGMVGAPEAHPWSSYLPNATGKPDGLITPHPAYQALGTHDDQRGKAYSALCDSGIAETVIAEIRKATRLGCAIGAMRRSRGRPYKPK
jgi:putative transposase